MLFNSLSFFLFFVAVLGIYLPLRSHSGRKFLLLASSYIFYGAWNPAYVLLLATSACLNWLILEKIRIAGEKKRRIWLIISVTANLMILAYFKYAQWLLEVSTHILSAAGISYHPTDLDIILPLGISFYTFAALSLTIDVYRREIDAPVSLLDYALFLAFFPHLIAGPIVRGSCMLPQLAEPAKPSTNLLGWGLCWVSIGLAFKTVLADELFAPVANQLFQHAEQASMFSAWAGVLGFSAEIYFDFCGYSMCAIGLALCFGYRFPENFKAPYAAISFSDFWRRWHITLSTWLRDYLYIPLGGNRHGAARTACCLMATMLLGGLWHGASCMFVIWGCLHGTFLIVERLMKNIRLLPAGKTTAILKASLVFMLVTLTWIAFRADDAATALQVLRGLAGLNHATQPISNAFWAFAGAIAMFAAHLMVCEKGIHSWFLGTSDLLKLLVVSASIVSIYLYSGEEQHAFIYFQF